MVPKEGRGRHCWRTPEAEGRQRGPGVCVCAHTCVRTRVCLCVPLTQQGRRAGVRDRWDGGGAGEGLAGPP